MTESDKATAEADALWLDGYETALRDAYDLVDKGGRAARQLEMFAEMRGITL